MKKEGPRCLLSHPTHPHNLTCRDSHLQFGCFNCSLKRESSGDTDSHYYCTTCDVEFHIGCEVSLRKITHPYHLQHPLTLIAPGRSTFTTVLDECTWCEKYIGLAFYHCFICNFNLDLSCGKNTPLLTITNPKNHQHSLLFFPRPLSDPCDVCGLIDRSKPSYACFQCNYMTHQTCIDLPRVIQITRHPHRLSYAPFLPPPAFLCRICYKPVDIKYGQFSCNHEDCFYVAHSTCVTHKEVWDGKELEWEPEDQEETEDVSPFQQLGGGLIKHFSHEHVLRLGKYDGFRDAEKQCGACVIPIDFRDFYTCMECEFSLHEVVQLVPKCSGFRYKCLEKGCSDVTIDICCSLIPDYFTHKSHKHPLFFVYSAAKDLRDTRCKGCNSGLSGYHIECTQCEFVMCYRCATIPFELHYKYDEHPLTLSCGETTDDTYWCEVCEKKVDPTEWFYTCNICCITLHCKCVFGSSIYMKYGFKFYYATENDMLEVVHNNTRNTRPVCRQCDQRCAGSVYYKWRETANCSLECLPYATWKAEFEDEWASVVAESKLSLGID